MVGLTLFVAGLVGALLAGAAALIILLGRWVGLVGAAGLTALLSALVAAISYRVWLHPALKSIDRQLETVAYVADLIEQGYDWVRSKRLLIFRMSEQMLVRFLSKKG